MRRDEEETTASFDMSSSDDESKSTAKPYPTRKQADARDYIVQERELELAFGAVLLLVTPAIIIALVSLYIVSRNSEAPCEVPLRLWHTVFAGLGPMTVISLVLYRYWKTTTSPQDGTDSSFLETLSRTCTLLSLSSLGWCVLGATWLTRLMSGPRDCPYDMHNWAMWVILVYGILAWVFFVSIMLAPHMCAEYLFRCARPSASSSCGPAVLSSLLQSFPVLILSLVSFFLITRLPAANDGSSPSLISLCETPLILWTSGISFLGILTVSSYIIDVVLNGASLARVVLDFILSVDLVWMLLGVMWVYGMPSDMKLCDHQIYTWSFWVVTLSLLMGVGLIFYTLFVKAKVPSSLSSFNSPRKGIKLYNR